MPKFEVPVDVGSTTFTGTAVEAVPHGLTRFHTVTIRQDAIPSENRGAIIVKCHLPEELSLDTTSQYNTPFADIIPNNQMTAALLTTAGYFPLTQAMTAQFWSGSSPIQLTLPLTLIAWSSHEEITRNVLLLKSLQMPRTDAKTRTLVPPGPRIEPSAQFWEGANTLAATAVGGAGDLLGGLTNFAEQSLEAISHGVADGAQSQGSLGDKVAEGFKQVGNNVAGDVMNSAKDTLDKLKVRLGEAHKAIDTMFDVNGKISIALGEFLYFDDVLIEHVSDAYNIVLGPDGRPLKCQVTIQATTRLTPTYEDLVGAKGIYRYQDPLKGGGTSKHTVGIADYTKTGRDNSGNKVRGSTLSAPAKETKPSVKSATFKSNSKKPAKVKRG